MPIAICGDCGCEKQWQAKRGVRLADLACPQGHRGVLNAAAWDREEQRYIIVARRSANRGKRYVKCACCGRRKLDDGRIRRLTIPVKSLWSLGRVIPAGEPFCRSHEISRECGAYGCLECVREVPA